MTFDELRLILNDLNIKVNKKQTRELLLYINMGIDNARAEGKNEVIYGIKNLLNITNISNTSHDVC